MTTYEFRVRGVVTGQLAAQATKQSHGGHETVVRVVVDDAGGVYDMLEHLYGLGLELLDVRVVETDPARG